MLDVQVASWNNIILFLLYPWILPSTIVDVTKIQNELKNRLANGLANTGLDVDFKA